MSNLIQDVRYALRVLRKNPGYAFIAVLALALGIGANSTIFITVNAMLLRPLPFRDLDRIVNVWTTLPAQHWTRVSATAADFRDWQQQNNVFERLAAGQGWDANLSGSGVPERLEGYQVTGDFFPLLGMQPMLGRTITGEDVQSSEPVVVLAYSVWKNRFASDSAVVGKTIKLNGQDTTVVGVMPREFDYPFGTGVWAPLSLTPAQLGDRKTLSLTVVGRLKPSISLRDAQAQMDTLAARLASDFPVTNAGHGVRIVTVVDDLNSSTRDFLVLLMASAGFVLLLACANIANLQLARAISRQKELALRTALGASRGRLVRQLLVESQLIALTGGAVGLLLAVWGTEAIRASLPPFIIEHIPGLKLLHVDTNVLAFTTSIAVLTGLLSGILPALQASSSARLQETLKEGGRTSASGGAHHRMRSALVVSEVTLALVLLVGSGLLVKGFQNLMHIDQGFDASNLLTFRLTLPKQDYPQTAQRAVLYESLSERFRAISGVESATAMSNIPSSWNWTRTALVVEGQPAPAPGERRTAISQVADPEFLRTLRIPLLRGRAFTASDGPDTQPVVLINDRLARRYFPGSDPLGKRVRLSENEKEPWRTIVGIVADVRPSSFDNPVATTYTPVSQTAGSSTCFALRTTGDPLSFAAAARAQVGAVDPSLAIYDIRTQEQVIGDNISGVQFSARMMIVFGILSLLLAGAGIYAVMSYSVAQRTHEIGIRMALGARPADVLRMIVGYALKLAVLGIVIGLPLAFAAGRIMSGTVMGVVRADSTMLFLFPAVLGAVALLAGYIPARWATRVDPMIALRSE